MRTTTRALTVAVCALALTGCAAAEPTTGSPGTPATGEPSTATPPPPATASTGAPLATDVPPEAMLPAAAWLDTGADDVREESEGVAEWRIPTACDAGSPVDGVAMRTVAQGSGEYESTVGVHQVVTFAGADAAVVEADRLAAALTACTQYASDDATTYVVEPVQVGAQGLGLATDYYGESAQGGSLDDAMGTYLAVTRRGNAVTLVAVDGGEGTVGTARATVTANAQGAWELLCGYDSAGC